MNDATTTLQELKERTAEFVRERDWEQFHTPKNLSMSIAIEAAELMEHFQWLTVEESRRLAAAVADKLAKNAVKYPCDRVRGKAHKYTYYQNEEK